ncbi:DUF4097 family beta strand repeat-containing protein [Alkalihalobacterium alkalinitrilicum]|uniref:DUF4097 family beta strand repeat-containing protein n=1 Tax=Alkalihalobacterium alkalinitrilicum TaxID=427920 RepID=UPI000995B2EB|nr:DUF4097 domain-containing protein [Alkalihalobacterium alkalinitrilicum]
MEERKMILKMIEDGKITAEEGLKLLNALQQEEPKEKKETKTEEPQQTQTSLSERVDWDSKRQSRRTYRQTSGASVLTGFIENAIQKIKDLDLDFNFGSFVEVEHIFHHKNFHGKELDFSLENGSITLIPWEEEDIRVECKAKVYRARDAEEGRQTFLQETIFEGREDRIRFYSKVKSVKIQATCYIPKDYYESIKVYTFNGHIKGEKLQGDKLEVKVVNGSVHLTDVVGKRLYAETVNGPIDITSIHNDWCEVKTMNGAITLEGKTIDVNVETVNGAIRYRLDEVSEPCYADLKATTGSINVSVPADLRIEGKLETNVGGFTCDLNGLEIVEEKKDFVQKTLSFIANKECSPRFKLEGETNTGSIQIEQRS